MEVKGVLHNIYHSLFDAVTFSDEGEKVFWERWGNRDLTVDEYFSNPAQVIVDTKKLIEDEGLNQAIFMFLSALYPDAIVNVNNTNDIKDQDEVTVDVMVIYPDKKEQLYDLLHEHKDRLGISVQDMIEYLTEKAL